jgi:integrase
MPGKAARFQQIQTSQLAFWRGHFGNECLLSKITPALIQEGAGLLSRTMTQRGKLFTPATINRYLTLISHVFSVAVSWQWLAESPASHIRRGKEPPGRTRWLDDDEREKLLAACAKSSCPFLLPIVTVALCTGARRAEILNLTWRDVDLKAGSVTFPKTKNGSPRTVPLTGAALESLREHAKTRRRLDTPLLFPSYHKPQNPILIRDPWLQAVAAAGLENFRFHDLRHSAGSYLIMSGADLRVVAQILGHKEMRMTMRYTHLSEAFTREALQKMTTKFMK